MKNEKDDSQASNFFCGGLLRKLCTIIFLYGLAGALLIGVSLLSERPHGLIPTPIGKHAISIVVPTYKEFNNIKTLCDKIFEATSEAKIDTELVIVDDNSKDGTEELVEELIRNDKYNIKLIVREDKKGLASAVLLGLSESSNEFLVVMDADLSHPPEKLPTLVRPLFEGKADFVIASRNIPGGGTLNWPLQRKIISWGATLLARPLVPGVTDPMSGFFSLTKERLKQARNVNLIGFKIGLELLVKASPASIDEIPFIFADREFGVSKLKMKTQIEYVKQLLDLYPAVYSLETIAIFMGIPLALALLAF